MSQAPVIVGTLVQAANATTNPFSRPRWSSSMMSILCCCRNRQLAEKDTQTEVIKLPSQPPRARLSKTLSRSDTNMYLSSILASRGPSQLMNPTYHNIVDPEAVEVEDSDEEGPDRDTQKSNIGTLGSLKTKLIRRLSHRTDTKSGSRPSIGASDEELARRAELKRLMHKRIQEELKSEEEEDLRVAPPGRPSIDNCREPELSGGGPRDTIEFSVSSIDEQETKKDISTLPEASIAPTSGLREAQPFSRRTSCSKSAKRSVNDSYHHGCNQSFNDIEPTLRPPSSPHLTPVYLLGGSGRGSPSTASWRLSYSAIHIESYIAPLVEARQVSRPQSPELGDLSTKQEDDTTQPQEADTATNFSNPTIQDETVDTSQTMHFEHLAYPKRNHKENDISSHSIETGDGRYSPLDMWLRSQEFHCASIIPSRPNSEMTLERPNEPSVRGKVENLQKPAESAGLSVPKNQTTDSSSILQEKAPGAWPGTSKHIVDEANFSLDTPNNESIALRRVFDRMENARPPDDSITEDQSQDMSSRYTSSRYTTRPNSRQATPRDSRLSLTDMPGNRRVMQSLTPIYGPVSPYRITTSDNSDISSYRTALNKTPSSDHTKPKPEVSQFSAVEPLSINTSETGSFRQREEELKSIKKRFGVTPVRLSPRAPVRSKFREEFEDPKGSNSGKGSILSKLHLALPKRVGASSSHRESNKSQEEIGLHSIELPKPNILLSSSLDPNAAVDLRHLATKQEPEPRHWRWKAQMTKLSSSRPTINNIAPRPTSASSPRHSVLKAQAGDQNLDSCPTLPANISNDLKAPNRSKTNDTIDIHAGVLQEWVEQLQAEDLQRQSRAESGVKIPKRQPRRLRTPPESWAKWPSHTREERTAPAGEKDKVSSWDFAVVIPNPSKIEMGGKLVPKSGESTATSRSLTSHVSKALKSGWNKMVTHTGSLGRASQPGLETQQTMEPRRFLEYPELELLPTAEGYREVQALDQQIDTMKRRSTSRDMRNSSSDGARRPLASRIAEEVHKFQIEDGSIPVTQCHTGVLPTAQFLSPAHALFTRRSRSYDPKLINAPKLQCTYEECVQTQMLHDDNDNSTSRMIIKRAKSTGNIEVKSSGDAPSINVVASNDSRPILQTQILGLRRHRSLGWLRGRRSSSDQDKPATTE